jgi:twinkle protein
MSEHSSELVSKGPCEICGSSDANALFSDGHTHCYACGTQVQHAEGEAPPQHEEDAPKKDKAALLKHGEFKSWGTRKLTVETMKHFGVTFSTMRWRGESEERNVIISPYYSESGVEVFQKLRVSPKDFAARGNMDLAMPFGYKAFPKSGKMVVITEGEVDAMSFAQCQQLKWPVWSIPCGADAEFDKSGKRFGNPGQKIRKYMASIKHLTDNFETVVIMFDNDDPGRFSAKCAAEVIGHKARIATLPLKDASDMLVAGRVEELINAMWRAEPYRPEGVITMTDAKAEIFEEPTMGQEWFLPSLNKATYGRQWGQIIMVGAGTGIGKTDLFTQQMTFDVTHYKEPIGIVSLEQPKGETGKRLLGKHAKKSFHIPKEEGGWTTEEFQKAWDSYPHQMVHLYDSFGVNQWSAVKSKMEYWFFAFGVRKFYIDHLTAFVAREADENKALGEILSEQSELAKRHGWIIHQISHLSRPREGKSHEEGGRVTIGNFRGSSSIGFWAHTMIGLERAQQADDPEERTTTKLRVLKDRYSGRGTGKVIYLGYDTEQSILFEKPEPSIVPSQDLSGFQGGDFSPGNKMGAVDVISFGKR